MYCMPAEGVDLTPRSQTLSSDEIVQLVSSCCCSEHVTLALLIWCVRMQASLFVGAGVDKIRLTGGEPTLRPDLVSLVHRLHSLPGRPAIGLTSNGIALRRSLRDLRDAGAPGAFVYRVSRLRMSTFIRQLSSVHAALAQCL